MGKGCFFLNNTNKTKKKPASSLSKQEDVQCQFSNNAAHLLSEKKKCTWGKTGTIVIVLLIGNYIMIVLVRPT